MTVCSFVVGTGFLWFLCFLYVVHAIARGESPEVWRLTEALMDETRHLARTRIKRGTIG